jgi:bisphosphoglycerate-independent phosphoglycerate mutase (AlkP superfamily)
MDPSFLSGVLLTNAPIRTDDPSLEDMAPTILRSFAVAVPEDMKGRDLQSLPG